MNPAIVGDPTRRLDQVGDPGSRPHDCLVHPFGRGRGQCCLHGCLAARRVVIRKGNRLKEAAGDVLSRRRWREHVENIRGVLHLAVSDEHLGERGVAPEAAAHALR